jgi:hypothetical protein
LGKFIHNPPRARNLQKSGLQEAQCLEVPYCFLDETVQFITQFAQAYPSELVFNLDEVGIADWEDQTAKVVIVPKSMCEQMIHHKVNRNLKHISAMACISAAG